MAEQPSRPADSAQDAFAETHVQAGDDGRLEPPITDEGGDATADVERSGDATGDATGDADFGELTPTVPARIGRYVVLRRLGAGAMGVVLVGYDPELDRRLAIKLIHPRVAARTDARARMLREAKGLARVSHPNVVQVYDAGTVEGRVFIAMELVDGEPMSQWQKDRRPDEILAAYVGAGRGLAAAHAAGLVHRDFKPDNVLVDREGRARVLDFGLVRAIGQIVEGEDGRAEPSLTLDLTDFDPDAHADPQPRSDADRTLAAHGDGDGDDDGGTHEDGRPGARGEAASDPGLDALAGRIELPLAHARELSGASDSELNSELTQGGAVMGTPAYMSPEQWRGQHTDARSDQFSFCIALWEALCGERPFQGRTPMALVTAVCAGELQPPADGVRMAGRVRATLERGLRPDPDDRFEDMDALLADLEREDWTRRSLPLAIVALLAFGVLAWGRFSSGPIGAAVEPPVCERAGAGIDEVWGGSQRGAVLARFDAVAASGSASAPLIHGQLDRALDDYAARWREAAEQNCEATRVRHQQSEELLDLRGRCLDARRTEFAALIEVLSRADAATVDQSLSAVEALPSLRACDADQVLEGGAQLPDDEALAERVTAVRRDLAGVGASLDLGRFTEASDRVDAVVAEAEGVEFAPLAAEIAVERGRVLVRMDRHDEAQAALEAGFFAAVELHDDPLTLRAAVWLAELEGNRSRPEFAELWANQAKALLGRHSDAYPGIAADLADNLSWNAYQRGDYELAHREAMRGLETLDAAELEAPMRRVALWLDVGVAAYASGDLTLAHSSFERSLDLATKTVGRDNAKTTGPLNNLAFTYRAEGELERARALLEESLAGREAEFGQDHAAVGLALSNLADVEIEIGDGLGALAAAERSFRILNERRGADALATVLAQQRLGLAHGLVGELEAGIEVLQAASAIATAEPNPDLRLAAELDADLAVLHAAAGDAEASERALTRSFDGEASWGDLVYAGQYAAGMGQPEVASRIFTEVDAMVAELPASELDAGSRRRLASARMWHAQLLVEPDPDRARTILEGVPDEAFVGAPALLADLEALRVQLGEG